MKTLGLTGGIGSGKSTVAQLFENKGIPVFNSDSEAKRLYKNSDAVKRQVISLLGKDAYIGNIPNRAYIANLVFKNSELLDSLNQIIHPALNEVFESWKAQQKSPFVVKEAAILFESGAYKQCNAVLTVTADEDIRIERVMKRDGLSKEQVQNRMSNQWPEMRKIELSDFVIDNGGTLEDLQHAFDNLYPDIDFRMS